jgi:hypothetical protein
MGQAEKRLRQLGVKTLRLSLVKPFHKLQAFYERQGYVAGETKQYHGVPFEVLYMEKSA